MRFTPLALHGVVLVEIEPHADERGLFARTFCEDEFAAAGLVSRFAQSSTSFNAQRGTVRGLHFAAEPHAEVKLVRCTAGAIFDVLLDLRPGSPTFRQTLHVELSALNRRSLYIPQGLAHGFQTLQDGSEILYMIDRPFVPGAARGVRWDDPVAAIQWPESITTMSDRDRAFPDWP